MRVLGIDPGTLVCGWGVVEATRPKATHLGHGAVRLDGALADRLAALHRELSAVVRETRPDAVAVEGVFTHKNARSALILGHARGVALLCAAEASLPVHEYPPATVKKTVAGSGRAEKKQIQTMVGALLGITAPKVEDAADALAIALCHVHHAPVAARLSAIRSVRPAGKARGGRRG
jgi:crossover junction endodeoxyribonuclease RuvC